MNLRKYLIPTLHVLVWIIIYFLPDLLFEAPSGPVFMVKRNLHFILVLFFFYLNYFILVPRLLLHKKQWLFSLAILFALIFTYYVNDFVMQKTRTKFAVETINTTGTKPLPWAEKRHERHRRAGNAGAVVMVLMSFFVSTITRETEAWYHQEKERKELEKQQLLSELSFLKSQVNPHFLFNSLNGIYALAIKKSDKTPDAILQLSELMRHMLYESDKEQVDLEKETAYLENYIQLQKLRLPPEVQIHFQAEGNLSGKKIAPMLFIPFIENAFKHGVDTNGGNIQIKLQVKENRLSFDMMNRISKAQNKDTVSGIGLANVRKRLDLLYSGRYHLEIKESNGNFIVHLHLNLEA
ncbi:histidine kinase [Candidatus Sulfidibacterium hydrothermale]|uniref:sensor histidine kinase n=1 Tax=Candidatus Sulfidibacterium hydrothermale TaxID=2875962 RepID=UPI001F0B081D|nr:histidine kinase [Candidatus Sulfidibacterium hydrothermale]UBM62092.1 histidine kinase [Candidatus Sulfidibacterium hydrothermale]